MLLQQKCTKISCCKKPNTFFNNDNMNGNCSYNRPDNRNLEETIFKMQTLADGDISWKELVFIVVPTDLCLEWSCLKSILHRSTLTYTYLHFVYTAVNLFKHLKKKKFEPICYCKETPIDKIWISDLKKYIL